MTAVKEIAVRSLVKQRRLSQRFGCKQLLGQLQSRHVWWCQTSPWFDLDWVHIDNLLDLERALDKMYQKHSPLVAAGFSEGIEPAQQWWREDDMSYQYRFKPAPPTFEEVLMLAG